MEPPRERLRQWIESMGSRKAAAEAIGCDPTYLSHLMTDAGRQPGLKVAFGIERATEGWAGGQICAAEWAEPSPAATGTDG